MAWDDYHNTQKYSECQLVSVVNALYCLTGTRIGQDSKRYEKLVDLCKARHGSAIDIEAVHHKLNIIILRTFDKNSLHNYLTSGNKIKMPIEVTVWHHKTGLHSALIIDWSDACDAVRVTNFEAVTTAKGWVFWENFQYFISDLGNKDWAARLLGHKKR